MRHSILLWYVLYQNNIIMSQEQKKRRFRYKSLLLMREPYEMTYWKQKLNTPYRKLIAFIKQLIEAANRPVVNSHK
jgi:hypothetical protein